MRRAITFGVQYRQDNPHPVFDWVHPDGYVVIEAANEEQARAFAYAIFGDHWSFDYDLAEFEGPEGPAEKFHPKGRLAEFSALPQPVGFLTDGPKLDPLPWCYGLLGAAFPARSATQETGGFGFDPRPGYSQRREDYS